jgi:outer membrane protein OmpA-like peptidoglycan-associated protein
MAAAAPQGVGSRQGAGESGLPSSTADRPGFARPGDVAVAAPPATVSATPIPEPAAAPVATVIPPAPSTPVVTVPATPAQPVNLQADIAHAQSGAVPASAITRPPGGPLEVAVIQFGRASSGLGGRDSDILRKIAQIQRQNGGTVRVVAHAEQDVTGASAAQIERGNYDVSRRRAINIADRLMALGVPRSAIVAEAASDSEPKYATNTARGVAANRRAEIFLDL